MSNSIDLQEVDQNTQNQNGSNNVIDNFKIGENDEEIQEEYKFQQECMNSLIQSMRGINVSPKDSSPIKSKEITVNGIDFIVPVEYTIFKVIGRGSYGSVLGAFLDEKSMDEFFTSSKSFDENGKRTCIAIKKLIDPFRNSFIASRALREIAILKSVNHENIIEYLYGYSPDKSSDTLNDIYLCSELMHTTLANLSTNGLSHKHFSFFIYQIMVAIQHLHDHSIYHRDLKPANIGVDYKCRVKLLDFGLSRVASVETKMTPYVVTRYYRAPELLIAIDYNEKVDVWSVGCILGELLLGKVLFQGNSPLDQWKIIVRTLGSPTEKFIRSLPLKMQLTIGSTWGGYYIASRFNEIFSNAALSRFPEPNKKDVEDCRSLLKILLEVDPSERGNDQRILKEPYLTKWMEDDEMKFRDLKLELDFSFEENGHLTIPDYRLAFFQIVDRAEIFKE